MTAGTVGSLLAAIAFASFFVAYASSYVICLYLQRYLTLRSPRLVKYFFMLLIAVTVTVFAVTMHEHVWSSKGSSGGITSSEIYAGKSYESDTIGNIAYATDGVLKSESILAVGYAQIGDEYFMVLSITVKSLPRAEQPDMKKISRGRSVKRPKISANSPAARYPMTSFRKQATRKILPSTTASGRSSSSSPYC